jgi:hypothetical protein
MKRLYNFLVPKFLRDFDEYLLRNYPVVWRTKAIFVLFYGVVGAVVLFAAGFFYPVDAQHLRVSSTKAIIMNYEAYHLWLVLLVSMGLCYWAYRQYQLGFPFTKMKDTLLTLVLYALCVYVLFAFTTPAFRLGTIYKTAYHWIDTDEMKQLEASNIYPHGFVLLEEDTLYKGMPADTFFQRRERIFNTIWHVEDTLSRHLYTNDTLFWEKWYRTHEFTDKGDLDNYRSSRSYRSYRSYLSMSYLSMSSRPIRSYWSSRSYLSYLSDESYWSYRSYRKYLSSLSDRSSMSVLSSRSDLSYLSYLSYLSSYEQYKQKNTTYIPVFDKYGFNKSTDSTRVETMDSDDSLTVYRAALPYSVEYAIYSVKHARLYLAEKIYVRHWALVLKYVFLLAALFYFIPFLSLKHLLIVFLSACTLSAVLVGFLKPTGSSDSMLISNAAYLIIPTLAFIWMVVTALRKQQLNGFLFSIPALFMGLLLILVAALFIIYRVNFKFDEISNYQPPYDLAFYGIQVLGILGAVLTTYVRTLPKG